MNQLEIKYHNNREYQVQFDKRLIENGGYKFKHEILDKSLNDFYEFYIDGESLLSILLPAVSLEWFMANKNGLLGTKDKVYDELLVMQLLNHKLDENTLLNHFRKHEAEVNEEYIKLLMNEINSYETVLIYGCKVCGDRDCGGIDILIKEDSNYIYWNTFNEETSVHNYYQYKFKKEEYKKVFKKYLANWKKATIRNEHYH